LTDFERLVELLLDGVTFTDEYKNTARQQAEYTANQLLANGVLVPAVKLNQRVYMLEDQDYVVEGVITHLEYNSYTTPKEWITIKANYSYGEYETKGRLDLMLNRIMFLNKEDAETALKERKDTNKFRDLW
jgi:hypothetical protein